MELTFILPETPNDDDLFFFRHLSTSSHATNFLNENINNSKWDKNLKNDAIATQEKYNVLKNYIYHFLTALHLHTGLKKKVKTKMTNLKIKNNILEKKQIEVCTCIIRQIV